MKANMMNTSLEKIFNDEVIMLGHITGPLAQFNYILTLKKLSQYAKNVGQIDLFRWMIFFVKIKLTRDMYIFGVKRYLLFSLLYI